MNLSTVKAITIPEGSVVRILVGGEVIWKKSDLPNGYTALEYIETNGTQYINTGFRPNQDSRIVMDFAITRTDILNGIFGGRSTTTSKGFYFDAQVSGTWRFGYGTEPIYFGQTDTERHTADLNKNVFSLDGIVVGTATEQTFTAGQLAYLGSIRGTKIYDGYARIYSCQVYDNDVLVRDFVPCINVDGEVGMYDKANKVFYGNAGSGEFITAT